MPHAWLTRQQRRVSTLDLCGHGRLTLLTGLAGQAWQDTAKAAADRLGIALDVHVIGPGQPLEDSYGDAARLLGVPETGAVLVRPDRFVAWRARLLAVLQAVLQRDPD